jgi:molybdopterin molybdotransferase
VRLRCAGESRVGESANGELRAGEAWRVYTGSELPPGADSVVMQEEACEEDGGLLRVDAPLPAGVHVLPAGADISPGALLAREGQRLRPQDLALLAQCCDTVFVRRQPVLGILSTGDEFFRSPWGGSGYAKPTEVPGSSPPSGMNASGSVLLAALARTVGAEARHFGVSPDDPAELRCRIEAILDMSQNKCDVLVITGGSSGGRRDFAALVLASLPGCSFSGKDQHVSSGRPLTFARIGDLSLWVLPGHMLSLFMTAQLFIAPLLQRLMGLSVVNAGDSFGHDGVGPSRVKARLARSLPSRRDALAHYPVTLEHDASSLRAWPVLLGTGKNAVLRDMAGWVTVSGGTDGLRRGQLVSVRLFT